MTTIRSQLLVCLGVTALAVGGCDSSVGTPVTGLESLAVELVDPPPGPLRGTKDNPTTVSDVTINVQALNADHTPYTSDLDVDVFLSYGGTKIGQLDACGKNEDVTPIQTIHLPGGTATGVKVHLTRAFGVASLWLEQHVADQPGVPNLGSSGRAFGSTPEMIFRNPTIPDVQTPLDLAASTATYCIPFNGKQVNITSASVDANGKSGQLVVTSRFAGGYVLADTGAIYDPVTNTGGFNHLYVFTFGAAPPFATPGRVLNKVEGNVSKFVGFTELNFPYQEPTSASDTVQVPAPFVLTSADVAHRDPLKLLRLDGATVTTTAKVCPLNHGTCKTNADCPGNSTTPLSCLDGVCVDNGWKKFNNFSLNFTDDPLSSGQCDSFVTFAVELPGPTLGSFDPFKKTGATITVTGMLRNFSGQADSLVTGQTCMGDSDCAKITPAGSTCVMSACTFRQAPNCRYDAECTPNFGAASQCVEGGCKNGRYDFWVIAPRDASDITVK